jgi:hypothetical protein
MEAVLNRPPPFLHNIYQPSFVQKHTNRYEYTDCQNHHKQWVEKNHISEFGEEEKNQLRNMKAGYVNLGNFNMVGTYRLQIAEDERGGGD